MIGPRSLLFFNLRNLFLTPLMRKSRLNKGRNETVKLNPQSDFSCLILYQNEFILVGFEVNLCRNCQELRTSRVQAHKFSFCEYHTLQPKSLVLACIPPHQARHSQNMD